MNALYNNTVFRLGSWQHLLGCCTFLHCLDHFLIGKLLRMVAVIHFLHLIDDLAFLQTAVPECGKDGFPVTESKLFHNGFHIFRTHDIHLIDRLCFAIRKQKLTSLDDIIVLQFIFKPLIDLIFCLCRFYNIQPVTARPLGILAR